MANRVVVATGGTSGIGPATAPWFVIGRRKDMLDASARATGGRVVTVRVDMTRLTDTDVCMKPPGRRTPLSTSCSHIPVVVSSLRLAPSLERSKEMKAHVHV